MFLNYGSFLTFYLLNKFCEIVHFQKGKGGLVPLFPPAGCAGDHITVEIKNGCSCSEPKIYRRSF